MKYFCDLNSSVPVYTIFCLNTVLNLCILCLEVNNHNTCNNFVMLPYRLKKECYGEQLSCSCILVTCMVLLLGNIYTITAQIVYMMIMHVGFMAHKMNCFTALN